MKILMVNKFLYPNGGSETYMFKLGKHLILLGHEVQYFGMEHIGRCVGNNVNAYTSDMNFHGGSKLSKLMYPIKTIYSLEGRRQIRKVLDDFQPNVVHLNNFNYQLTPSIILEIVKWRNSTNHPCRIVYTAHDYQLVCPNHMLRNPITQQNCENCLGGNFMNCIKGKCIHGSLAKSIVGTLEAMYWKFRGSYKYIDSIICPSNFVKVKLDTNPLFKNKTTKIANFVEIPSIEKKLNDNKYVLYFGRLSEEKGVRTLVEVCKRLPNIPFVFVGTGPLSNEVKNVPNIDYRGFKQSYELLNLIANAQFCVCPSVWYEVFGLSMCEAVALGTPVVASNIGGIPESLGRCGLLVSPGNVQELTETVRILWNDKNKLESLRIKCNLSDLLSIEQYVKQLINVYSV